MKTYSTFIFDSYNYDPDSGLVTLKYSLDDEIHFEEKIYLPATASIDKPLVLDSALFALHIIGGISYFKTCIPKNIEVRSGKIDEQQASFWNMVYTKGLSEFFYKNEIDPEGKINFQPSTESQITAEATEPTEQRKPRCLVPIGGGKDSMVPAELLKQADMDFSFFRLGAHQLIGVLAETSGVDLINAKRSLDTQLFSLNEQGALNGHVPITGYISFLTIVVSILLDFDYVVFSNERSANEGNIEGTEINHQWSKSAEFEIEFQKYVDKFITPDIKLFSLLRPMSELKIMQIFSLHPEYFKKATSCNKNWRILSKEQTDLYCCECPKCAFVFCQMAAFLPMETVTEIFGKNLFEDESLIPLYKELLGLQGNKPFECVGTQDEVSAAFLLALTQEGWEQTKAVQMFLQEKAPNIDDPSSLIKRTLDLTVEHSIPTEFLSTLSV